MKDGIEVNIRSWYPKWLVAWKIKRSIEKDQRNEKRKSYRNL